MITERQKKILDIIIEEYINSAEPISSQILAQKYDFGLCSATIRIEMQNLTNLGFLEKPYISSGRIPTDKAYRIFVDGFFEEDEEFEDMQDLFKINSTEFDRARELTDFLASNSSSYIVFSFPQRNISWQAGLNDLIRAPEFSNKDFILNFLSFVDEFSREQGKLKLESKPKVFIGEETPFEGAHDFSLISSENVFDNNEKFRLSLIGPKRMDYRKNVKLINSLLKIIAEKI